MKPLMFFLLFISAFFVVAQVETSVDFDSLYKEARDLSYSKPLEALEKGHILFQNIDQAGDHQKKRAAYFLYLSIFRRCALLDTVIHIYEANAEKYLLTETGAKDTLTGFMMYELGCYYWKKEEGSEAVKVFQDLIDLGDSLNFKKFELYGHFGIGQVYIDQAMTDEALPLFLRTVEIAEELNNPYYQVNVLRQVGNIHRNERQDSLARHYYQEALNVHLREGVEDDMLESRLYMSLGNNRIDVGEYRAALKYYYKARKIVLKTESGLDLYSLDQGMSYAYQMQYEQSQDPDDLDSAVYYYESMMESEYAFSQSMYASFSYRTLAGLEEKRGNYKKATEYWPLVLQWRDSALTENAIRDVREVREKYETEKKEQQIALQQERLEKESAIRNGLISGTFLVLIIGGLVINRQKLSIRNKAKEKELTELKLAKTKDELSLREQELLTYVITISQKNNLLHNVKEVAKKAEDLGDANSRLKKINFEIENGYNLSQQWDEFRQRFEKIHVKFFDRLAELAPDLTNTDRRICAYLKLGLSSKQIANLQNVSVETVEVRRSQIRKKLGIPKQENLSTFIMNIS